ncbi:MAG: hypothetical protein IPQ07_02540 [Myxococcales bacterium]|nr:hypothetical protein [Myxococcales bacterium]
MRRAWLLGPCGLLGACLGDAAVEVSLVVPNAQTSALYDTSCVTAVEVYVDGANYPTDVNDYLRDCIDLTKPGATFQAVKDQIRGKFDTAIPTSGMSGMELYAYNGTCDAARHRDYDLIFYASAPYIGGDTLSVPITPNISCVAQDAVIRPVDFLKYVKTQNCAMSTWTEGKLALATLSPLPFTDETYWWGGQAAGSAAGGLVALRGPYQNIGPKSCLAVGLYTDDWNEVTCIPSFDQRVCGTGAELEAPMINLNVAYASADPAKTNKYGALVVGAVLGPGPLAGATVTIDAADADKGEVVYLDMPPGVENGTGALTRSAGTATGPSGLFGIYTMAMVHVTITAGGKTVKRMIAGNEDAATAVFVKL